MRKFISHSWMPILTGLIVAGVYILYGRNLMLFVCIAPFIALLLGISVLCGVLICLQLPSRQRHSAASCLASVTLALVGLSALMVYGNGLRDPLWFLLWSRAHGSQIGALARRDGVIQHWEGWGIAGLENDSYLVSDPRDSIAELKAANQWAQAHNFSCEIVATQRMRRGFYILTTYNCAF